MDHPSPPPKTAKTTAEPLSGRHIPEDILRNILPRLPIKTLVRFRCVCKQWRHLLSGGDVELNRLHHHHHPHLFNRHSYLLRHRHSLSSVPADGDPSRLSTNLKPPEPRVSGVMSTAHNEFLVDLEVVGSTLGLFCLAYNRGTCVVVWNPATRDWYQLPDPQIPIVGYWTTSFAIAYDSASDCHYKIVRVAYGEDRIFADDRRVKAEVYDSRNNSWKEIANPPQVEFSAKRCGVIVEGVPYWVADRSESAALSCEAIISFNPGSDMFMIFKRPYFGQEEASGSSWRLGEVGGSLAVFVQRGDRGVDVWMMGDELYNSWVQQVTIEPVNKVVTWVKCWDDGEFLVSDYSYEYADHCRQLFLYDPWTNKTKMFPDLQSGEESRTYEVYVYDESLLSPQPFIFRCFTELTPMASTLRLEDIEKYMVGI